MPGFCSRSLVQIVFLNEPSLTVEQCRVHAFVAFIVADCLLVRHIGQVTLETYLVAEKGKIDDSFRLFNQLNSFRVLLRVQAFRLEQFIIGIFIHLELITYSQDFEVNIKFIYEINKWLNKS